MSARRFQLAGALLVLTVILIAGCGGGSDTIPIRGEVRYNGQPLKDGLVVYLPKQPDNARQATGRIRSDGSFVLTTFKNGDGAVPGEYNIVIYAYAARPDQPKTRAEHEAAARTGALRQEFVIPEKYVNPQTSGLRDTIDSNHSGFKRIDLSS